MAMEGESQRNLSDSRRNISKKDQERSASRLERLASHMAAVPLVREAQLARQECAKVKIKHQVHVSTLVEFLTQGHQSEQEKVYRFFLERPHLQTPVEIHKDKHRELCMRQLTAVVREAGIRPMELLLNDPASYFVFTEAIGHIDLSLAIKLGVQFSLWGGSVINLGTKKHRDKYLAGISNLDYPGCFAMTELHHGSNVQALQTTATFDRLTDEFVINTPDEGATKWWIGNAAVHGKFATVFARLKLPSPDSHLDKDMGVHAFIVPIRSMEDHSVLPGVEIRDCGYKVGLNGVDNGALRFSNVRIPRDNLLNRFGDVSRDGEYNSSLPTVNKRFAATLGELVGGRVGLAYGSVGVLKASVTIAIRYALLRQQFGPPNKPEISILDYQSHQQRLMPLLASTYGFHFATQYLVNRYAEMKVTHDDEVVADVHALSAGLKSYITSYTAKALSTCREACGGHGYAAVNRFGSLRNDHDIFQTFEGDNTVLLQQVAADLLKQYKEKFQGGALSVTWNYLRESMGTYLNQTNPVVTHREGHGHLRDPNFQLDAFQYRTARLLHTAALRLRKHSQRLGSFGAWNRCLNHLLTLAESHIESVILAKFIEAVNRCPDKDVRSLLKLVCDLYALDRIWEDIGTYRNQDYVAPNKAKAIHRLVEYLSYEVRGVAKELVDGFGVPDFVLRAPIGLQNGQYSEYMQYVGF
ncbi:acyl-coenzyme A oxidase, peroxisomal [Selaginella moellendorffii]|nr:acyl-coenzyme A oxidase, peroxisomal [Selaginella moellendorffii]|eukprot:XP_002991925.2 acyl-coenzyme A oxidase, peroxisomal [Selaginella moellendorffii]